MTDDTEPAESLLRRTVLKASAVGAGALAVSGSATARDEEDDAYDDEDADDGVDDEDVDDGVDDEEVDDADVDEPDGFEVEILAEHSPFADDVAATFELTYLDAEDEEPIVVDLEDASTAILAEVNWEEGARSGWHRHPGMSIVQMVEGEIEHTMEGDCVPRTYSAGDAWIDPGYVHKADSEDGAFAYVTFLGIPDGEPATEWVEPVDC